MPVRCAHLYTVPGYGSYAEQLVQADALAFGLGISRQTPFGQQFKEPSNVGVFFQQAPVEPAHLVVLTISVVVPVLSPSYFVAHRYHRDAQRKHRHGQEVLDLAISQPFHLGILARTFHAAVPAAVIIGAVAILLSVCFVVLSVVGNKVVECEAIVTRDKIDGLLGLALLVTVTLRAAQQAIGNALRETLLTAKEAADVIAKASVPFLPAVSNKAAHLIQPGGVPRFGDELRAR